MPSELQTAFLLKGFSSTALHKGGFLFAHENGLSVCFFV